MSGTSCSGMSGTTSIGTGGTLCSGMSGTTTPVWVAQVGAVYPIKSCFMHTNYCIIGTRNIRAPVEGVGSGFHYKMIGKLASSLPLRSNEDERGGLK